MSQENVEIVRRGYDYFNRTGETYLAIFHPDLVYHPRADEPDPNAHIGLDAYERLILGFRESFPEITLEILELIDAGDHVKNSCQREASTGCSSRILAALISSSRR